MRLLGASLGTGQEQEHAQLLACLSNTKERANATADSAIGFYFRIPPLPHGLPQLAV